MNSVLLQEERLEAAAEETSMIPVDIEVNAKGETEGAGEECAAVDSSNSSI